MPCGLFALAVYLVRGNLPLRRAAALLLFALPGAALGWALLSALPLPLTALSACVYLFRGYVTLSDAGRFVLPGLLGAAAGTLAVKQASPSVLHVCFALLLCWAGVRLIMG